MAECRYLEGENLCPLSAYSAKLLIGRRVTFLRGQDIDKSGRGYFWPREGIVISVHGRNIAIGQEHDFYYMPDFKELVTNDP